MKKPSQPATYVDPLTLDRVAPFIGDVTRQGSELVAQLSEKINEISVRRSIQIGYMLACQDHGLPLPEFTDPADEILKGI